MPTPEALPASAATRLFSRTRAGILRLHEWGAVHAPADIGDLEARVDRALLDGDAGAAAAAISTSWPDVAGTDGARLRALIDRLPDGCWDTDPWMMAAMGSSYRSLDSPSRSAALPWFRTAEALLEAPGTPPATVAMVRVHHSAALRSLGRLESASSAIESARSILDADFSLPSSTRIRAQAQAALHEGMVRVHEGRTTDASRLLRLALGLHERSLTPLETTECAAGLALCAFLRGDLPGAAGYVAIARDAAGPGALASGFGAAAIVADALTAIEQNRPDEGAHRVHHLARAARRTEWEPFSELAAAELALLEGRNIEGLDHVRRCIDGLRDGGGAPVVRDLAETLRGVLLTNLGEFASALAVLGEVRPSADHSVCPARFVAGIRLKAGDGAGCLVALGECLALGDTHSPRTIAGVLLLSAAANYELGNVPTADVALDRALHLAATHTTRLAFLLLPGSTLHRMLHRAADRNQPPAVHALLEEMRTLHATPTATSLEPLSERELDVAQHLFEDKTVSQIASDLFISTNTVKTHVRSIYRKLAATNRRDAVRRVRELGLQSDITLD